MGASEIDTIAKRAKLAPRKNPYWHGVSGGRGGVSLGYRKGAKGPGVWIAKIVLEKRRLEERLGHADDEGAPPGALKYRAAVAAALDWSQRQAAALTAPASEASGGPTVRSAVEAYSSMRERRSAQDGKNATGRLAKHVLSDKAFADTPLARLRAGTIETWRAGLAKARHEDGRVEPLAPATVNRLMNDLRAALNAMIESRRRELPPHLSDEVRIGTRAGRVENVARKQLLTDKQVQSVVQAAFDVDPEGDFGRLVMLAAATGARFSQLTSATVAHFQPEHRRILMPGSRKGRTPAAKAPVAIPLSDDVVERLRPAATDRPASACLLERWGYRKAEAFRWERDKRRPWAGAYEVDKPWAAACAKAGLPSGTVMYALRHSSIVRGLRAGLPVRLVASLHDTSIEMIERHYSAFIVDMTEELARRATLGMG
ncbi:integrase [Arsenicitalea aurantiaca]|uniref:Integrase n=1 Tax=Arsenicitalea aurantiaca TaxID=1783274 RepID=A0A433XKC7_9HYPH|nr:tyrosine-type recombinase/integrase [Arsenicitalea aurantiaca]RUT34542.1 integrase [Arsenicitalea aurantiaca]